ncbi:hypothetical protein E3T26_08580 [Cryobacterium sp. TMT1-21]|uniref:hypothetical protein n=1 Tax=Cryobacterium sp. TMT1-21 TaxID=1259234 RepID=UPI00106ADEF7|nr:hypothetical protein [Cryobacterium sp. TMT1-21]TFD14169.1 hypothetical protein E3T26_08580 [Cryobacterium sp. TMT1-21]
MTDIHTLTQQLEASAGDGENLAGDVSLLLRQLDRTAKQLYQAELSDTELSRLQEIVEGVASILTMLQDVSAQLVSANFDIKMVARV